MRAAPPGSHGEPARGISERFRERARRADADNAGPVELLPSRLAVAAREVLAADGVGISVFSAEFRLPLGASGRRASVAESLQFSAQQGPCWDAVRYEIAVTADPASMAALWPQFNEDLRRRTGFHSVASVPLRLTRGTSGAVDLYFTDDTGSAHVDLDDATVVAAHIVDTLNHAASGPVDPDADAGVGFDPGSTTPRWARGPAARRRNAVWIAAGMLINDRVSTADDALAVLRATAYSEGSTVDDVAAALVAGHRTSDQLRVDRPQP